MPVRLKAVHEMGACLASKAAGAKEERSWGSVSTGGKGRCARPLLTLEPRLRILVPEVDAAVSSRSGESPVNWVEADSVDGVELLWVASCGPVFAVALEGEVEAASRRA